MVLELLNGCIDLLKHAVGSMLKRVRGETPFLLEIRIQVE